MFRFALSVLALSFVAFGSNSYYSVKRHMGILVKVEIYAANEKRAAKVLDSLNDRLGQLDRMLSHYKAESELNLLVKKRAGVFYQVSPELFELLKVSEELRKNSGHRFDVGWQTTDRDSARELYRLDGGVKFLRHEVKIDFGGIGKGFILQQLVAVAKSIGVKKMMVEAGGDVLIYGFEQKPRVLSVSSPYLKKPIAKLKLRSGFVASSGEGARVSANGRSHIFDPKVQKHLKSKNLVTVVGPDGAIADGLATTIRIVGPDQGQRIVSKNYPDYEFAVWNIAGERPFFSKKFVRYLKGK